MHRQVMTGANSEKGISPRGEYWRERIATQERSGLSVQQFCEEQGLNGASFYVWRKRLSQEEPVRFALVETGREERPARAEYELELQFACAGAGLSGVGRFCGAFVRVRQPPARSRQDSVLGCVTNVSENLQSCTEDGSGPPGVDFQELISNHPELLRSKGVVVNVRGKGVREDVR
jgi:hypothetical protein